MCSHAEDFHYIDIDCVCRACLKESNQMSLIYEAEIKEMFTSFTALDVDMNDKLPRLLCHNCEEEMKRAQAFRDLCLKSNGILKHYIAHYKIGENDYSLNLGINDFLKTDFSPPCEITKDDLHNIHEGIIPHIPEIDIPEKTEVKIEKETIAEQPEAREVKVQEPATRHRCDKCPEDFQLPSDLEIHQMIHRDGSPPDCLVCNKKCKDARVLKRHVQTHMTVKPFQCDVCSKTFADVSNLTRHARKHRGEKRHLCNVCGKGFYESNVLSDHMRLHTGEKPFGCELCGSKFSNSNGLRSHKISHRNERKHTCDVCQKSFSHSFVLKKHRRTHSGERPYSCKLCGKSFTQSHYVSIHMRQHTGETPFSCKFCNKTFTQGTQLQIHMRTHTGVKPYVCSICDKACTRSGDLVVHMRTHTGERPFACPSCPKRFVTSSHLKVHLDGHAGSHKCFCGRSFDNAKKLSAHIKTHKNADKPVCDARETVSDSDALEYHKKSHEKVLERGIISEVIGKGIIAEAIGNLDCNITSM